MKNLIWNNIWILKNKINKTLCSDKNVTKYTSTLMNKNSKT